jgi:hypothetical protein
MPVECPMFCLNARVRDSGMYESMKAHKKIRRI